MADPPSVPIPLPNRLIVCNEPSPTLLFRYAPTATAPVVPVPTLDTPLPRLGSLTLEDSVMGGSVALLFLPGVAPVSLTHWWFLPAVSLCAVWFLSRATSFEPCSWSIGTPKRGRGVPVHLPAELWAHALSFVVEENRTVVDGLQVRFD